MGTLHRPPTPTDSSSRPSASGVDPDTGPRTTSVPAWRFRSLPSDDRRPSDREPYPRELALAVRAAHGAGVSFEWRIRSGRPAGLTFRPGDAAAARWWIRVLLPVYPPGQWKPAPSGERDAPGPWEWFATPARAWPEPLIGRSAGVVALMDAVVQQASLLPPGLELAWSSRPTRLAASPSRPEPVGSIDHRTLPPGTRPIPRPSMARPEPAPDLRPVWESRLRLRRTDPARSPLELRASARSWESATRTAEGNGLRFSRFRPWHGRRGPAFPLPEVDLLATFPTDRCPGLGADLSEADGLPLGRTSDGQIVRAPSEPHQGRHLAIVGETGMGKSSLLVVLARRAASRGGLVLLDPLGETARAVRDDLPPAARDRLTWIDTRSLGGLNALGRSLVRDAADGGRAERQVNDLVHALRLVREGRYSSGAFWGPRLDEMLTRALRAAAAMPDGTLVDAHALLAAEGRGTRGVPPEAMEAVRELADRIRHRPEDADGARRLLHEVVRSPTLVRMLCARSPELWAEDLVGEGRVVLIAGDARDVGESTARYLMSVYLALVWNELLARPGTPKTWVVLDEAQWFGHESLAEMLRLARRRNVHVVLATQSIGSLPEGVAEAIWTNVADFVAFRGSPGEARELARSVRGAEPGALVSLPRGEAVVLLGKGQEVLRLRTARRPAPAGGPPAPAPSPGATAAADPGVLAPGSAASADAPEDRVRRALAERARAAPRDRPLKISLAELRHEVDPTGAAVRATGDALRREGALLSTGRDARGACWWIDPARLVGPPEPGAEGRSDDGPDRG